MGSGDEEVDPAAETPRGAAVDPEVAATLEQAFSDVAAGLRPMRARVLSRLDSLPRPRAEDGDRRRPPVPFLGRRRGLFLLLNAIAAGLLLTAYGGYLTLIRVQRQALTAEARHEVRNLAIVLRALKERAGPAAEAPEGLEKALARLGVEHDPFGNPYAYEASLRVYSFGPNGRDDGGRGDDIVAYLR